MAFDLMQMLGMQSKKPHYEELDPYAEVRPLLKQYATEGYPEWKNLWQQQWSDELMPGIQEEYQGKRGMGAASTPEIAALGRSGRGLMTDMSKQDLMGRLQALMAYGRTPTQFDRQEVTSAGQNLQNVALPLAAAYFGGQMDPPWGGQGGPVTTSPPPTMGNYYGGGLGGIQQSFDPYGDTASQDQRNYIQSLFGGKMGSKAGLGFLPV